MSGGHFDYIQYRFDDVASSIEHQIATNEYEPAIVNRFQLAADTVRLAGKMIQRVDWLVSDDDGPDSFLTRWHAEGLPVPEAATTRAELAAKNAEIARLRAELSSMATKYSWAVDTFGTGFSGYEAVLLHQKRYAEEGHPSNWRDSMKEYAARAALTEPTDEA